METPALARGDALLCQAPEMTGLMSAAVGLAAAARSRYGSSVGSGSETAAEPGASVGQDLIVSK